MAWVRAGVLFISVVAPTEDVDNIGTFALWGRGVWVVLCLKLHRVFSSYEGIPAFARGGQFH